MRPVETGLARRIETPAPYRVHRTAAITALPAARVLPPSVLEETVLQKATVAVRRVLGRLRRDTTSRSIPARAPHDSGLELDAAPARSLAAPRALVFHSGARRRSRRLRLDSPERFLPVLVIGIVLVASVTAAPGLAGTTGPTGATEGYGSTPRLVVGGESGPNAAADSPTGPGDGVGVTGGSGEYDNGAIVVDAGPVAVASVDGQFLEDGTLLKPVVVDTTVEDARDQLRTYTVRSGDTLTGIASRFGVRMMTIWWANKLNSKDELHIGQKLIIPPVNGLVHTVTAGETLASVAATFHVDAAQIVSFNGLTDQTLVIGQVLMLPGARGKAIPTPKPTPRVVARTTVRQSSGGSHVTVRPPTSYGGGVFAWPVVGGYISQYYSARHPAIDIAAPHGTPVRAAAAGTVLFAGWKNNGGGYQVWIAHGSGLYTTYNHMSALTVRAGEHVGRAEMIGRVGATGWATGPHLHFEVWRGPIWDGGTRVNPLAYL